MFDRCKRWARLALLGLLLGPVLAACSMTPQGAGHGLQNRDTRLAAAKARKAMTPTGQVVAISTTDPEACLAEAIYYEAASESLAGQRKVADVVKNRAAVNYAGADGICQVVHQQRRPGVCQFSYSCQRVGTTVRAEAWQRALEVARAELARPGLSDTRMRGVLHYHAGYVKPKWRREMQLAAHQGAHLFYRSAEFAYWQQRSGGTLQLPAVQVAAVMQPVSDVVWLNPARMRDMVLPEAQWASLKN